MLFRVVRGGVGDRPDQGRGVCVPRRLEQLGHDADLAHMPGFEHQRPVGDGTEHAEIVRHEDHRQPAGPTQLAEQLEDGCLDRHVERRGDLVTQHHGRVGDQGAGQRHSLALAAAERGRVPLQQVRRQPQLAEHLADPAASLIAVQSGPELPQRVVEDRADGLARVERRVGVLEDDLDLAPDVLAAAPDRPRHRRAVHLQRAGLRREQPGQGAQQRRFAAAALPHHPDHLARADREGQVVQRRHGPAGVRIAHADPGGGEQARRASRGRQAG